MELQLPPTKIKQIQADPRQIMRMAGPTSARILARQLGKMNSTICVIPPASSFTETCRWLSPMPWRPTPRITRATDPLASQLRRAEMVGYRDVQMEWEDSPQEGDRHDYRL